MIIGPYFTSEEKKTHKWRMEKQEEHGHTTDTCPAIPSRGKYNLTLN